ncbi:uracil-DNA glycosylase [Rhodococcoides corynebacterioides]|uniref:uracil-DNA glycosylase n=1 Tax=Rhodococcoides corynebacterioides TaxID=53972 RepID=UPI00082C8661|nr:uracil-DNA glycosylase [Rhodococcus corynebacterioides]MBY6350147.1 uracil-DNA glycosylase [Rhodococcus corynebacterioides]MBY6362264.1 uracil-DNA glycosylase [Rhodococcus corynebacterioides]
MTFGPIDPGWARALEPVGDRLAAMADFVDAEIADGREVLPARENVLRAFERPFDDVRVLLVGQDPYPTPGHAVGLSFSVAPDVAPVPRSLHNIFTEYVADLDLPRPTTGDLTPWADRGVLLLNRVLTVRPGAAASHRRAGWEAITARAITALAERGRPLVAVLWGRDAATAVPLLGETPVVSSVHPSPLSASRGFFGSRPFSSVNDHLVAMGEQPVDWRLP